MPKLTLFIGKGGVGKTTVSAAYGLYRAIAEKRKSVLLLSTDPAHSLADIFGQALGDRPEKLRLTPRGRLDVWQVEALAERVAGLVLVGAPGKVPEAEARQIMTAMRADYEKTSAGFMERLLDGAEAKVREQVSAEFRRIQKEAALKIMEEAFAYDPVADLDGYPGPTLSITAAQADGPNDLHRLRPDLPHQTIAGASHWVHMDKPEGLNRILDEFLAGIDEAEQHDPHRQHAGRYA